MIGKPAGGYLLSRKTALIACADLGGYCYGEQHPFKVQRYRLAHDLMEAYGLLELPGMELVRPRPVTEADFQLFLKERGTPSASRFDLNRDGRRDYLDDYIFTANYLVKMQEQGKKKGTK